MKKFITILGCLSLSISLSSCNTKQESFDIVCSCYPTYDFATKIVKDKLIVKNLIKPGVEPHDYEMTTSDVKILTNSKLFLTIGLGFETYTNTLNQNIKDKTIQTSNDVSLINTNSDTYDPHIWLDPQNAKVMASNILEGIIKIDNQNKDFYTSNYDELIDKLDKLDKDYKEKLVNLSSHDLVTSHNAFAYLCKRYNLNQINIAGLSPEDEPSATRLKEIIDYINSNNVKTIFYEELASDEIVKSIASQTGVSFVELSPLEGFESEESSEDYFSIMYENLDKIYDALK